MKRRRWWRALLPLALAGACAALGARVYEEWKKLHEPFELPQAAGEAPADPGAAPGGVALNFPAADSLASIAERPLFSSTRRPAENAPTAPAATTATEPLTEFTLTGTVASEPDGQRFVTVRPADGGQDVNAAEGSAILGWTVVRIADDRAVFRRGAIETTLVLQFAGAVPPDRMPPDRKTPPQPVPPATGQQPPKPPAGQTSGAPK
jgi:hypothetical protein